MSGLYAKLGGTSKLETEGVYLDLEVVRIKIARAGGGNKVFLAKLAELNRKHGKALAHNIMSDEKSVLLMQELYASELVKDWQYPNPKYVSTDPHSEEPEWLTGIEQPDGSIADFTPENVLKAFVSLPNLWVEVHQFANSLQYFNGSFIKDVVGK